MSAKYPVGGSRQAVYSLMERLGFKMSQSSDKKWTDRTGIQVHIFGAGSMARVYSGKTTAEIPLDDLEVFLNK